MFQYRRFNKISNIVLNNCVRNASNPGMDHQLKFVDSDTLENDPEGFGNVESDFMNVHKLHKTYKEETIKHQEKVRLWIVKNKYFKQKQPNFLTYAEKEQIRLLYNKEPEEWTPEKLAESFPATPNIISKIIKSKWNINSRERILSHDKSALKNWEDYKMGKFKELDIHLKEHLKKFTERNLKDIQNCKIDWPDKPKLPKPKSSQFLNIITSCNAYKEKELPINPNDEIYIKSQFKRPENDEDTFIASSIIDKAHITYKELQKSKKFVDMNLHSTFIDSNAENNVIETEIETFDTQDLNVKKFETSEITINTQKMLSTNFIKEKICIPKEIWKRGATYKVKDSYYHSDGDFLYRVPGMA